MVGVIGFLLSFRSLDDTWRTWTNYAQQIKLLSQSRSEWQTLNNYIEDLRKGKDEIRGEAMKRKRRAEEKKYGKWKQSEAVATANGGGDGEKRAVVEFGVIERRDNEVSSNNEAWRLHWFPDFALCTIQPKPSNLRLLKGFFFSLRFWGLHFFFS